MDNRFPVLDSSKYPGCPKYVRRDALNEDWAQHNHHQSLDVLADRHGLSVMEIYWNVNRTKIKWLDKSDLEKAIELVKSIGI